MKTQVSASTYRNYASAFIQKTEDTVREMRESHVKEGLKEEELAQMVRDYIETRRAMADAMAEKYEVIPDEYVPDPLDGRDDVIVYILGKLGTEHPDYVNKFIDAVVAGL